MQNVCTRIGFQMRLFYFASKLCFSVFIYFVGRRMQRPKTCSKLTARRRCTAIRRPFSAQQSHGAAQNENKQRTTHIGLVDLEKLKFSRDVAHIVDKLSVDLVLPKGQKSSIALQNSKRLNRNEYIRLLSVQDRLDKQLEREMSKMENYRQLIAKTHMKSLGRSSGGYPGQQEREVTLLFKDQHGRVKQLGFYHKSWGSESSASPRQRIKSSKNRRSVLPSSVVASSHNLPRPSTFPKAHTEYRSSRQTNTEDKLLLEGTKLYDIHKKLADDEKIQKEGSSVDKAAVMSSKLSPLYQQLVNQETNSLSISGTSKKHPPGQLDIPSATSLNTTHFVNTDFGFHKERLQEVGWSRHKDSPRHQNDLEQDIQNTAVRHIHTLQSPHQRGSKATEKLHNLYDMIDPRRNKKTLKSSPQKVSMITKRHSGSSSDLNIVDQTSQPITGVSIKSRSLNNLSQNGNTPRHVNILPTITHGQIQVIGTKGKTEEESVSIAPV